MDKGFGATRGFKTAADAIAAGVDPKSTDLADLVGNHVYRSQRAINQVAYQEKLAGMKASDGKPLLASIEDSSSKLNPDGSTSATARVPKGYEAVQAGDNVLVAHQEIAPLLKAQYGDSALRNHWLGGKATADFKGWRVGTVAKAMGQIVLASLIGAQLVNLASRGKPTWENEEEGHRWDAWVPGGKNGFFWSPLSLAAEFSHALSKYIEGGQSPLDALLHVGQNKLSGGARAALDLATGHDGMGRPFGSTAERLKAAALDASPLPMQMGALVSKDPKAPLGLSLNHQPGSVEKQLAAMAGIKLDAAPSARSRMYQLAKPFRPAGQQESGTHAPSAYGTLRRLLDSGDLKSAAAEIQRLGKEEGRTPEKIAAALGVRKDGTIKPELFTGGVDTEKKMLHAFSPEQRKLWMQAQKDHALSGRKLLWVLSRIRGKVVQPDGA